MNCLARAPNAKHGSLNGFRVAVITEGTRGDVQPYVALGERLQAEGCRVHLFTNSCHVKLATGTGMEVSGTLCDTEEALRNEPLLNKAMADGDVMTFIKGLGDLNMKEYPGEFERTWKPLQTFAPQLILYSSLSDTTAMISSIVLEVPSIPCFLGMYLPTVLSAPLGMPSMPLGSLNMLLWKLIVKGLRDSSRQKIQIAQKHLNRSDIADKMPDTLDEMVKWRTEPFFPSIHGLSSLVMSVPADVPSENIVLSGWWLIDNSKEEKLAKENNSDFGGEEMVKLEAFLKSCPEPPVYIGWGSMTAISAEFMTNLAVTSLQKVNRRGVILKGWAALGPEYLKDDGVKKFADESVLFLKSAPQRWLFPQCACTVTHGGSGTTATALNAGVPTIITPVWLDQYDFAAAVNRLGVGVGTCKFKECNTNILSAAIEKCLSDESIKAASKDLGAKLRAEDGCAVAVERIANFVDGPLKSGKWLKQQKHKEAQYRAARNQGFFAKCMCAEPQLDEEVFDQQK